jgi:hypothetical protein
VQSHIQGNISFLNFLVLFYSVFRFLVSFVINAHFEISANFLPKNNEHGVLSFIFKKVKALLEF